MSLVGDDSSHLVIQWSKPKLSSPTYHICQRGMCSMCRGVTGVLQFVITTGELQFALTTSVLQFVLTTDVLQFVLTTDVLQFVLTTGVNS